jgi:hypothetical protein
VADVGQEFALGAIRFLGPMLRLAQRFFMLVAQRHIVRYS